MSDDNGTGKDAGSPLVSIFRSMSRMLKGVPKGKNRLVVIKGFLGLSVILLLAYVGLRGDVLPSLHPDRIRAFLGNAGRLAPILYMGMMALAVIISPIPSVPLDIAAGAFFGPLWGTVYSAVGALGGAVASFLFARFLGRAIVERFLGGHIHFCRTCSDRLLAKIVFFSRLLPFVSFDIISYGAGLTQMSLKAFAGATFLGMLPLTFAYNYFGSFLVVGEKVTVVLGIAAVGFLIVFPMLIERYNLFSLRRFFQHPSEEENHGSIRKK
jgi:uncharacterized membrane protein YdjX (TVP38/TMEM64 family)